MAIIKSMTGFALCQEPIAQGSIEVSLRMVNGRGLDSNIVLSDNLPRHLCCELNSLFSRSLGRGSLECNVNLIYEHNQLPALTGAASTALEESEGRQDIDWEEACRVLSLIKKYNHNDFAVTLDPDVIGTFAPECSESKQHNSVQDNSDELEQRVMTVAGQALLKLDQSRSQEGEQLRLVLLDKLQEFQTLMAQICLNRESFCKRQEVQIKQRLQQEMSHSTSGAALMGLLQKADFIPGFEYVGKLSCYMFRLLSVKGALVSSPLKICQQFTPCQDETFQEPVSAADELNGYQPLGRRLDFIMREISQGVQYLSSRGKLLGFGEACVELTVLCDQMREQVQNIE